MITERDRIPGKLYKVEGTNKYGKATSYAVTAYGFNGRIYVNAVSMPANTHVMYVEYMHKDYIKVLWDGKFYKMRSADLSIIPSC